MQKTKNKKSQKSVKFHFRFTFRMQYDWWAKQFVWERFIEKMCFSFEWKNGVTDDYSGDGRDHADKANHLWYVCCALKCNPRPITAVCEIFNWLHFWSTAQREAWLKCPNGKYATAHKQNTV